MRAEEPIILTSTKISDLTKTILAYSLNLEISKKIDAERVCHHLDYHGFTLS